MVAAHVVEAKGRSGRPQGARGPARSERRAAPGACCVRRVRRHGVEDGAALPGAVRLRATTFGIRFTRWRPRCSWRPCSCIWSCAPRRAGGSTATQGSRAAGKRLPDGPLIKLVFHPFSSLYRAAENRQRVYDRRCRTAERSRTVALGKEEVCAYLDRSRGCLRSSRSRGGLHHGRRWTRSPLPLRQCGGENLFFAATRSATTIWSSCPRITAADLKALRATLQAPRPLRFARKRTAGEFSVCAVGGLSFRRAERYGRKVQGGVGCGFARLAGRGRASQTTRPAARSSVRLAGAVRRSRRTLGSSHKRGLLRSRALGVSHGVATLVTKLRRKEMQCYASRW